MENKSVLEQIIKYVQNFSFFSDHLAIFDALIQIPKITFGNLRKPFYDTISSFLIFSLNLKMLDKKEKNYKKLYISRVEMVLSVKYKAFSSVIVRGFHLVKDIKNSGRKL